MVELHFPQGFGLHFNGATCVNVGHNETNLFQIYYSNPIGGSPSPKPLLCYNLQSHAAMQILAYK